MTTKIFEDFAELYPLWRDLLLGRPHSEKDEVEFLRDALRASKRPVESMIDLGGGVGLHAGLLKHHNYEMTLFDRSQHALWLARKNFPGLSTIHGKFETMHVPYDFDASICMWSTTSYILDDHALNHFYAWQRDHIRQMIVLDQLNLLRYPQEFHQECEGESASTHLAVACDWTMQGNIKETRYVYTITNKQTGKATTFSDDEVQRFLTPEEIQQRLGEKWSLFAIKGNYSMHEEYQSQISPRMVMILVRNR